MVGSSASQGELKDNGKRTDRQGKEQFKKRISEKRNFQQFRQALTRGNVKGTQFR